MLAAIERRDNRKAHMFASIYASEFLRLSLTSVAVWQQRQNDWMRFVYQSGSNIRIECQHMMPLFWMSKRVNFCFLSLSCAIAAESRSQGFLLRLIGSQLIAWIVQRDLWWGGRLPFNCPEEKMFSSCFHALSSKNVTKQVKCDNECSPRMISFMLRTKAVFCAQKKRRFSSQLE